MTAQLEWSFSHKDFVDSVFVIEDIDYIKLRYRKDSICIYTNSYGHHVQNERGLIIMFTKLYNSHKKFSSAFQCALRVLLKRNKENETKGMKRQNFIEEKNAFMDILRKG